MRAWSSPVVPTVDMPGPAVRVFDSSAGALVETTPTDGVARMYVCGITPYDATHLGHAATFVAFDLLNRAWRLAGHRVRYVQNVTDVDDPLLERATAMGESWTALAERETDLLRADLAALRVLPPEAFVGAVESIPLVVALVELLRSTGSVYDLDGDLYFSVHADPAFGEVSGWSRERMLEVFADRGGDPARPGKKDPLDCLLWQGERLGEPAWDSPFGRGRPGWHVECAAIALDNLGHDFDVQGGGSDLVFPHHEMSASEAQVADPRHRFARAYVHAGMVGLDGEKMSKSRGNLVFVSRLRESGVDPMAIRLALLAHHYRTDWDWTDNELAASTQRLARWREWVGTASAGQADTIAVEVPAALADDLDAPRALAALDAAANRAGDGSGSDGVRALVDAALGIRL